MKIQNFTKTNYFLASIICLCSINIYCQIDISDLPISNLSVSKKVQVAHYPLTAKLHNTAVQDHFLEVYPYDVSGNAKHGEYKIVSKRKQEGEGLYYPASPPFYPIYSRKKKKIVYAKFDPNGDAEFIANPGKKFLDPDNYLTKITVGNDGAAKKVLLNKMIWDVDGDGKRSQINPGITEEDSNDPVIRYEKQLKFPFKSNAHTDTYFSFPEPFSRNISGDFTVTFWLNPRLQNICSSTIPIIETHYFSIELSEGRFRLTRKENGVKVEGDVYFSPEITSDSEKCQNLLNNKWKFYGLSFKSGKNPSLTLLSMFKNEELTTIISPLSANFPNNIIPTDETPIVYRAKMMGQGFAGSLYSVRFFKKALNKKALFDIVKLDYKILRRKPHKNHYLSRGVHYNNPLDKHESNRFGHLSSAKRIGPDENVKIESFLPKNYDTSQGYTVSFWTKIEADLTHDGFYPFNENTDERFQFFYGKTSAHLYAGMQRVKDKLGVNRYFLDENSQELSPIFAWLWEPGAFNSKGGCEKPPCKSTGWYHVVLVYYPSMMRVYLFHPGENDVYRRLLYLGSQNISDVTEWGIGNPGSLPKKNYQYPLQSADIMDDFKVYSWPLSLNDVKTLHKGEEDVNFFVSQKLKSAGGLTSSLNSAQIAALALAGTGAAIGTAVVIGVGISKYGFPFLIRTGYQRISGRSSIHPHCD